MGKTTSPPSSKAPAATVPDPCGPAPWGPTERCLYCHSTGTARDASWIVLIQGREVRRSPICGPCAEGIMPKAPAPSPVVRRPKSARSDRTHDAQDPRSR